MILSPGEVELEFLVMAGLLVFSLAVGVAAARGGLQLIFSHRTNPRAPAREPPGRHRG